MKPQTDRLRVLVVCAAPQVRRELRQVLPLAGEAAGFLIEVVGEAGDPVEARRLARALHPDAALVDLEMGEADGLAVAREIANEKVRVAVLTGRGGPHLCSLVEQIGIHALVLKGAEVGEIVRALRGAVSDG